MRLLLFALLAAASASAQDAARLATFVDCPGYVPGCDLDFFQTEVGFARFVRDPADAAVYVLVVDEDTGGGGERFTLFFEGRRGAARGRRDTLVTTAPPAASDDDQRRALLGRLSLGLAGFASRTAGLADRISVAYAAPAATAEAAAPERDPWNAWVIQLSGSGFFQGQSQSESMSTYGSVSARRITDDLKLSVRPSVSYNRSSYELSDGSTFVSDNATYGLYTLGVKSLGARWSAGGRASATRSTFSNVDLQVRAAPAVEYNAFPYAESTRRQVRVFYAAGVESNLYADTTIFRKTEETLAVHSGGVATEFAQPWGSVDVYTEARQYLSIPDKYNVQVGGGVDLRLLRGLSLRVDGYYEFVRDQIGLRARRAENGEILTGDRELPTGFNYFASVGLSYSFGSIYNQVVNARFGD